MLAGARLWREGLRRGGLGGVCSFPRRCCLKRLSHEIFWPVFWPVCTVKRGQIKNSLMGPNDN